MTQWRKSSRSNSSANCVEVAFSAAAVAARDSKNHDGPVLVFGTGTWTGFIRSVQG
jgi:hypothetical protein